MNDGTGPSNFTTTNPDGTVEHHVIDAGIDPEALKKLKPRVWPTLLGAAMIAGAILCAGLDELPDFVTDAWNAIDFRAPVTWDGEPILGVPGMTPVTPVTPDADEIDRDWASCPPNGNGFHKDQDGAYSFSEVESDTSVVGKEKFLLLGFTGKQQCITIGSNAKRTTAYPFKGECVVDRTDADGVIHQDVKPDQRIVWDCVDERGKPLAYDEFANDLRTKYHGLEGRPASAKIRCVVGATLEGCQPKKAGTNALASTSP